MTDNANAQSAPPIHVCLDCTLKPSLWLVAAERAVAENPNNAPRGTANAEPRLGVAARGSGEVFGAILTGRQWNNGRQIKVRHLDGDPAVHRLVEPVAKQWEQFANITFLFVNDGPAEVRISYSGDMRSWSFVGTDALSHDETAPTMHYGWLTPDTDLEEVNRVVLHEFGHALGMIHEQSQPTQDIHWNTDAVYRYYAQQGWDKAMVDRNVMFKYSQQETQFTAFDPTSIMQYPIPAGLTTDNVTIGWNKKLSDIDKAFIGQIYPKPAAPSPTGAIEAARLVASAAMIQHSWPGAA